jgi:putative membrane protein
MKKLAITLLTVVGLATAFTSCKKENENEGSMVQDQAFITAVSSSNTFEMAAANAALSKTTNTNVTAFAKNRLVDLGLAATELQILAQQKQLDLAGSMPDRYQQKLIALNTLTDTAFNRQYAELMVTAHQESVNLFTAASQNSVRDAGLKAFAAEKLPAVKLQLEAATALKTQVAQQ